MKVAIIHDWLTGLRGGERCLQAFLELYPEADIYTLIHVPGVTSAEIDRQVRGTSYLNYLPGVRSYYRMLLPWYPSAARGFKLSGYNLVISLSHAAAKNVQVPKAVPHVCYCFSPMRYIWDQAQPYFGRALPLAWPLIKRLRDWDLAGAQAVDEFAAISSFVAARIRCYYHRPAEVIYPPVDTSWIESERGGRRGEAFLYAGALVPYKRPEVAVAAFNRLGLPLWVVGAGPELKRLQHKAATNIVFVGKVSDADLAEYYRHCRALIFPGTEDFGMIPVECQAAGRPVIGAYAGGLVESVCGLRPWIASDGDRRNEGLTGVFMNPFVSDQVVALEKAVRFFIERESEFQPESCIERARTFGTGKFYASWDSFLRRKGLGAFAPQRPERLYA